MSLEDINLHTVYKQWNIVQRRDVSDLFQVFMHNDSLNSGDKEDLSIVLVEALFPHKPVCDRKERISLESISEMQCEQLFRHLCIVGLFHLSFVAA